jgi:periplasmic protein TonB
VAAARFTVAFILASGVTFALFYLMQSLIGVEGTLDDSAKVKVVDFVRVKRSEDVKEKERKLPEKKKIDDTPPPPDMQFDTNPDMSGEGISIGAAVEGSVGLDNSGGFTMASADGDAVPMVRVPPQYPEKAMQRGIEGRVLVEFTISRVGTVKDAKVIAAEPSSIFNKAALKSVSQWKYNPKILNGKAVEQTGIRTSVVFKLGSENS